MKKNAQKIVVLLCVVSFAVTLITGCEEQNLTDTRKTRLIATESTRLKKELEQCNQTIQQQQQALEECQKEKTFWEKHSQKGSQNLMDLSYQHFAKENVELYQENKDLKAQIEELKKELEK